MFATKQKQPIPETAKMVYDGILFDVYHWEQELYDGSTTTFEKLKRTDTVEAICITGNEIILTKNEQPGRGTLLSLPGGRVDHGKETPEEAMKRELLEETGYKADKIKLWTRHYPLSKIDWTIHIFIVNGAIDTGRQHLDKGEKSEVKLLTFDEFLMLSEDPLFDEREIIEELFMARLYPEKKEALKNLIFGLS